MAFMEPYQTPALAAVLQTLAACAPPQAPQIQQSLQSEVDELEEGEYDPSEFLPIVPPLAHQPYSNPQSQPPHPIAPAPQPPPVLPSNNQPPSPAPSKPSLQSIQSLTEKASLITSYSPALRHTTHLLSTHPAITTRIRHLIHTAHDHENKWWAGRETLIKQLAGREEGRKKLDSVLASVGGTLCTKGEGEAPLDIQKELRQYDRKVHRAYQEMVKATGVSLGKLGVPFFCVKEELIVREPLDSAGEVGKGKVTHKELEALKVRMVGFLEDMVKE
ncbi:MAG: hypothetical protein Q9166_004970 [cf. Caloplaca sp. 2 TL-2023]